MNIILDILKNPVIQCGFFGWLTAQILKVVINAVVHKAWDFRRMIGDGGMPSAHSATVTAMALAVGAEAGFQTPLFGAAFFVAVIVMHDAMGVRRETEKQTKVIKQLVQDSSREIPFEVKLKEFVGHTPLQVFGGFCVGLVIVLLYYL